MANSRFQAEAEFIVLSNPFELSAPRKECSPEQILKMVKNGNFGLYREQIIAAFKQAGGSTEINLRAIIKLCLDVVAESCSNGKTGIRLWFDPFTGRLELEAANGLKDSLLLSTPAAVAF